MNIIFQRTLFGLMVLLFLSLLCCPRAFAAEGERVLRMDVDVHVSARNATLTVTERIAFVTDRRDTRGLLRRVLTDWELGKKRIKTIFTIVSATQDGEKIPCQVRESWPYTHVYIGGDGFLQPGRTYEYVLQYTITNLVQFRKKTDWLYWSVAGSGIFPIESASFRIFLPDGAAVQEEDAWTGTYENREDVEKSWRRTASGRLETTRRLEPNEIFLILTGWDKGFVNPPTRTERFLMSTKDKVASFFRDLFANESRVGFAFCVFLVVLAYASVSHFLGRDPRKKDKGTRLLLLSPPCPEAGYAGYVKTLAFDEGLLLADLVQLAVQGQIRLGPRKDHLKVEKAVAEWGVDISPAHRKLLQALFARGQASVSLGGTTKGDITAAQGLVERMPAFYKTGSRAQYSKTPRLISSHAMTCTALLVLFVPLLYAAFTMDSPLSPLLMGGRELLAFWTSVVVLPLLLVWLAQRLFREARRDWRAVKRAVDAKTLLLVAKWAPVFLLALLLSGPIESALLTPIRTYLAQDPLLVVGLWLAFGSVCFVFASMPVRTREGWRQLEQIEGLETYLKATENDSTQQLSPMQRYALPPMTPERYEALLPYAVALDAADAWTEAALSYLAQAKYQPAWYRGGFNLQSFPKSLLKAAGTMRPVPFAQGMERLMKYKERGQGQ